MASCGNSRNPCCGAKHDPPGRISGLCSLPPPPGALRAASRAAARSARCAAELLPPLGPCGRRPDLRALPAVLPQPPASPRCDGDNLRSAGETRACSFGGPMCMIDDLDPCEFYHEAKHKARKQHRCGECGRTIEPGETYMSASGKSDGDVWTAKVCRHCRVAVAWLAAQCGGSVFGEIAEDLRNHVDEYSRAPGVKKLARIYVGIRRQWKRFDGRGLLSVPLVPPTIKNPKSENPK